MIESAWVVAKPEKSAFVVVVGVTTMWVKQCLRPYETQDKIWRYVLGLHMLDTCRDMV